MDKKYTDMLGRSVQIPKSPERIISLVPSQTELLAYLGLEKEVVGITKFCVHPKDWFRNKQRVGGTKQYNTERIDALQPDLIIANKEENEQIHIEALAAKYPVWVSDVKTLADAHTMIRAVGKITGTFNKAESLSNAIKLAFRTISSKKEGRSCAYVIWKDPYMVVGKDTFIHDILSKTGFQNVFEDQTRYPTIDLTDLARKSPDYILLSSEPFPFSITHINSFQSICPSARVLLVDGELFSWYGPRLLQTPPYLKNLMKI